MSSTKKKLKILSRPRKNDSASVEEKAFSRVNDNDLEKNQVQVETLPDIAHDDAGGIEMGGRKICSHCS